MVIIVADAVNSVVAIDVVIEVTDAVKEAMTEDTPADIAFL